MELQDAIQLIQHTYSPGTWADLGCGSGLFTYALANLLPVGSTIYAIDKSPVHLASHPNPAHNRIIPQQLDFMVEDLPATQLEGILMANSLHYVKDKPALLSRLIRHLSPQGKFIIVEYETDAANAWVPYPIRLAALKRLFAVEDFQQVTLLGERNSVFRAGKMYAVTIGR
ncbi:class I SAM-dependent methyltransferase [Chitinophaga flava]|uniref:Methyltransferase type 11 n=1 Tax=Chitinophaga flava TaxID=2259036 RepID=A0A365XWE4_9BACT|nr:class I SAM-dependent methyltransferase [Chitinophaga flava]RBL90676.1 methyltransferase type 11 [Chitinophaga flava]